MKINNINLEVQANTTDAVHEFWGLFWFVSKILSIISGVLDHSMMQNFTLKFCHFAFVGMHAFIGFP